MSLNSLHFQGLNSISIKHSIFYKANRKTMEALERHSETNDMKNRE